MKLFCEQFSNFASSFPDKPCVIDEQGGLTYDEIDKLSNAIALKLIESGLEVGDSVAVLFGRQKEIVASALGILKAGGVYLPFDEQYPDDRLNYMLEDAKAKFLITDKDHLEKRDLSIDGRIAIDVEKIRLADNFEIRKTNFDDRAMILYTSGTTGNPKGVVHRQAFFSGVNDWAELHPDVNFDSQAKMGVMSGFTFVATNVFMFGILLAGGTLYIASDKVKSSTDQLKDYLDENFITHIFMPASLATSMIEDYDLGNLAIFAGGEKLRNFKPKNNNTKLYNFYGSTETATMFTARVYGDESPIPIGYLTPGVRALLLDENLRRVDVGEVGELVVSDARMSKSYLNLDELSEQKWIHIDGDVYFRTGDRMKCDESGKHYILGRIDNMVKLRGFRIETGEVEYQVAKAIDQCGWGDRTVVVTLCNINSVDHLCCYYESAREFDADFIKEKISNNLPDYMIPELWMNVCEFKKNLNGKVIRDDLPTPKLPINLIGEITSEVELRVVETAGMVLEIKGAIDPDDSFVALGGNSLSAMELASSLSEQGITIDATKILASDSLREIAERALVKYERLWSVEEYENLTKRFAERGETIERVLPLQPTQDDLICWHLTHPDAQMPNKNFMFSFDCKLEVQKVQKIINEITARHPEMRSSIVYRYVSVFQACITDRHIPIESYDLPSADISEVYNLLYESETKSTFDLEFSHSFRIVVINCNNDNKSWLFIIVNKIAYREETLRVLLKEIMAELALIYPQEREISTWVELLENAIEMDESQGKASKPEKPLLDLGSKQDLCIYSDNSKKKIFFVHTGNSGASAYYQLAQRIERDFSFSVFEPYNLYHHEDARHGIGEIAAKYIEIMKQYQQSGPYVLGGWCYGGVVAHEMACQLQNDGEEVEHLIMFDAHCLDDEKSRKLAAPMQAGVDRRYFETCPLFKDLREAGMIEVVIENSRQVVEDLNNHKPKDFHGRVTYFKPTETPAAASGEVLKYWTEMMHHRAGNYEKHVDEDKLEIVTVPGEHDTMMNDDALDIIVPKIYEVLN